MNNDTILKYISDLMDEEEKARFEAELKADETLKKEFEKITANLANLNSLSDVSADSRYFASMLPKIHKKLDLKAEKKLVRWVPALAFGISVFLIFFLNIPNSVNNMNDDFVFSSRDISAILSDTDDSTLTDLLDGGLVGDYNYYSYENSIDFLDIYFDNSILSEIGIDGDANYLEYTSSDDYEEYSEEEVNIIYTELINKKIL